MVYLFILLAIVMLLGLALLDRPQMRQAPIRVIANRPRRRR